MSTLFQPMKDSFCRTWGSATPISRRVSPIANTPTGIKTGKSGERAAPNTPTDTMTRKTVIVVVEKTAEKTSTVRMAGRTTRP